MCLLPRLGLVSLEELLWDLGPALVPALSSVPLPRGEGKGEASHASQCGWRQGPRRRQPGSLAPAWEGGQLRDHTCGPAPPRLAAHFLLFLSPAAPSFLGDQRNWGIGVGWSQEPRRPASQPQAQALPRSPRGRRAATPRRRKWARAGVGRGSGQWGSGQWTLASLLPSDAPWRTSALTLDWDLPHAPLPCAVVPKGLMA